MMYAGRQAHYLVKTILYLSIHMCKVQTIVSGSDSKLKAYSGHLL